MERLKMSKTREENTFCCFCSLWDLIKRSKVNIKFHMLTSKRSAACLLWRSSSGHQSSQFTVVLMFMPSGRSHRCKSGTCGVTLVLWFEVSPAPLPLLTLS